MLKFEVEEDSDSDVEEILVYADVKNTSLKKNLESAGDMPFRALGLDSDTPYIQINNYIFKGEYQDCLGTNLFFEEKPNTSSGDPMFSKERSLSLDYVCKTNQVLNLDRVFLQKKTDKSSTVEKQGATKSSTSDENISHAVSLDDVVKDFMINFNKYNILSLDKNDDDLLSDK